MCFGACFGLELGVQSYKKHYSLSITYSTKFFLLKNRFLISKNGLFGVDKSFLLKVLWNSKLPVKICLSATNFQIYSKGFANWSNKIDRAIESSRDRSSYQSCSIKEVVLISFAVFTGKHLFRIIHRKTPEGVQFY